MQHGTLCVHGGGLWLRKTCAVRGKSQKIVEIKAKGAYMGWFGTAFVGAVIGLFGWKLHRARDRFRLWHAVALGAAAATVAKLAGNLSGAFYDGQTLEWLVSVLVAIFAVAVLGGLFRKKMSSKAQSEA